MTTASERDDLLLVEDDDIFRRALARALDARGFVVHQASTCEQALEYLGKFAPRFAVVDLRLPDGSGLEVVEAGVAANRGLRSVVLTGWGSIATAMRAIRLGAVDFLAKPTDVDHLARVLRSASTDDPVSGDPAASYAPQSSNPPVPSLERVEWEHLQRVLGDCSGNVSQAARLLGLHRRSLQRKLAKRPPFQ